MKHAEETLTASPWAGVPPAAPPLLRRDPSLWFILAALAITTLLHYLTDIHLIPYHSIYRSLYYLPIAVAAVRYGWRGGVLTALSASALYIPHVVMSWRVMPSDAFNDLLENVVFLFVGALVGTIADRERTQRRLAQASAAQLAQANAQLHTQAQAAQRMEAFIGSVVQSIGSGVLTLDQGGHVVLSNGAAHRLLGTATVPPNVEALPAPVQTYLASDAGYQQVQLGTRTVGLHRAPLLGARGDREGTVLVVDDLTELHALQEQVQRSQRDPQPAWHCACGGATAPAATRRTATTRRICAGDSERGRPG
jgi:PAS domain-containing protein